MFICVKYINKHMRRQAERLPVSFGSGQRQVERALTTLPELETELVVDVEWEWSMAGEVDVDELVLVPSSVVFLKKLCCRA